jgi:CelD/BcsL family acetyltransferase involved in cellulose biosynthesis
MIEITLSDVVDFALLEQRWRDLEERAEPSFFQSWTWTGCLAPERFPNPVVLEARDSGVPVALALFNRGKGYFGSSNLWLGEAGIADRDDIFIEHNGLLMEQCRPAAFIAACLKAARSGPIGETRPRQRRNLILSGVPDKYRAAVCAAGWEFRIPKSMVSPFVDLEAIRDSGGSYLNSLSRNTRYQIRRSQRRYAALGPLYVRRARSINEAHDYLTRLASLHQLYWQARGKPGAFANLEFDRFHRALITRAFDDGQIDLLEVATGEQVLGYLYNFLYRGRVSAYQTGFDYLSATPHQKPGLTCHHLAIEMYLNEGASQYDFLAGGDRYKLSMATGTQTLHWIEIRRPRLVDHGKNFGRRLLRRLSFKAATAL